MNVKNAAHPELAELQIPCLGYPVQENFEAATYQGFIRSVRNFWRTESYQATVEKASLLSETPIQIESRMRSEYSYGLYAWLERRSQQFKYLSRQGLIPTIHARRHELEAALDTAAGIHPELLELDPEFSVPDYVKVADTHQHAGGLWRDPIDGFIYEAATQGPSFSMLSHETPVERITTAAKCLLGAVPARRLVELGCTGGAVARALKQTFPQAEIIACDISAPVLRLAHLRSLQQRIEVKWLQASAERLPLDSGSVDLVCSNYLVHEMPPSALRQSFLEARRVLRRGGAMIIQDMYLVPGGAVGKWLQAGFAARNNEPYAYSLLQLDLKQELVQAGFGDVSIAYSYPEPKSDGSLPDSRTHYVTLITAKATD